MGAESLSPTAKSGKLPADFFDCTSDPTATRLSCVRQAQERQVIKRVETGMKTMSAEGQPLPDDGTVTAKKTTRKRAQNLLGQTIGRKGAETRDRLIKATVELLEKRSIRDVSVADIASLAGTSTSAFYIYFTDVTAAALAAAERIELITPEIEALLSTPWDAASAQGNAYELVDAYVTLTGSDHAILRVRNLAADEGDKRFDDVRRVSISRLHALLTDQIERAQNGLEPTAGASAILALMERIAAVSRVPLPRRVSRKSLITAAAFMIASALTPAASGAKK
jgi:AcrR family transcriptional regulator